MNFSKNSLYIVSTPIGNLEDITLRAIKVLDNSDMILCEDTRRSIKLLNHLKIKKKLISYHKFNEKKQMYRIIEQIKMGKILSLISDAGTPLLSDPGKLLLNECINKKIDIPMRPDHGHSLLDDQNKKNFNAGYTAIGRLMGLSELRGIIKAVI